MKQKVICSLMLSIFGVSANQSSDTEVKKFINDSLQSAKSRPEEHGFFEFTKTPQPNKNEVQAFFKESNKISKQSRKEALDFADDVKRTHKQPNQITHQNSCSSTFAKEISHSNKTDNQDTEDGVFIFVSLSMPEESLRKYFSDAQEIGAKIIIQGLINNSFKDTHKTMVDLNINVDIDPNLFEAYAIKQVPVILHKSGNNVDQISGNIPIQTALEEFVRDGDTQHESSNFLQKLRG